MPTTIFLIVAAWAFGRASPQLRARLRAHPHFGATLRRWEDHGSIGPRAKLAALAGMGLGWLMTTAIFRDLLASTLTGACMAAVAVYILTRPSHAGPGAPERGELGHGEVGPPSPHQDAPDRPAQGHAAPPGRGRIA